MKAEQLWLQYSTIRDNCKSTIKMIMENNRSEQVQLQEPIELFKDPALEITGIKMTNGRLGMMMRSFGFLNNPYNVEHEYMVTVQDYLSIVDRLERQFNVNDKTSSR